MRGKDQRLGIEMKPLSSRTFYLRHSCRGLGFVLATALMRKSCQ
jgi:hypothetical protein